MSRSKSRSKASANQPAEQQWTVQPGTEVYTSDDKSIGGVLNIEDGRLLVHKGGLFSKDYRVPFAAIDSHTEDRINLKVTAQQAGDDEWDQTSSVAPVATQTVAEEVTTAAAPLDQDFDTLHVPVVEEQLEATTRKVERGEVRITSTVSEHEETIEVPVIEERVHIQRVPVDRPATAADLSIGGRTLDVAVYGEEIDLSKQARVVEEIEISKEGIHETRELSGTVRREDIEVVDETTGLTTSSVDTASTVGTVRPPRESSR
jgi:uncharacterized protein (TIGR02271 family)